MGPYFLIHNNKSSCISVQKLKKSASQEKKNRIRVIWQK